MIVRLLSASLRVHEQRMNDNKIEKPIEQTLQAQAWIGSSYHKHSSSRGKGWGHGGSYSSKKVVVARIMEALSKTTLVPITIQVQITLGAEDVVTEDEEAWIINQMWSVITAINAAIMKMSANQKVIIDPACWPERWRMPRQRIDVRTASHLRSSPGSASRTCKETIRRRCGRSHSDAQVSDGITKY